SRRSHGDTMKREREEEWRRLMAHILKMGPNWGVSLSCKPVQDAFRYFGLNPQEPAHRDILLIVLADVVFGPRHRGRRRGSQSWDAKRLFLLGCDYDTVAANQPKMSNSEAAKKIKRLPRYKHDSETTIRQRLPAARRQLELVISETANL